jgi:hypothetical protein
MDSMEQLALLLPNRQAKYKHEGLGPRVSSLRFTIGLPANDGSVARDNVDGIPERLADVTSSNRHRRNPRRL